MLSIRSLTLFLCVLLTLSVQGQKSTTLRCFSYQPLAIPSAQATEQFYGLIVNAPSGAKKLYNPFQYTSYPDYINIFDAKTNINVKYTDVKLSRPEFLAFLHACRCGLVDTSIVATKEYVNSQGFITLLALSATMPLTYNNTTGNFSTSINPNKLTGRYSPGGAGPLQEIDPGFGLDLTTGGDLEVDTSEVASVNKVDSLQSKVGLLPIFPYNHIHINFPYEPFLTTTAGQDAIIREIGNVIYDADSSKYFFVYTGGPNSTEGTTLRIYLASSTDGITWTKRGTITSTGSEDPYLVKVGSTYYLFAERRGAGGQHECVELWTGTDIFNLTSQGCVLEEVAATWESQDVSSPVVYIENGTWYMYYEGRSSTQQGAIGLATSADGITWVKDANNPLLSGTQLNSEIPYATHVVPDDIIKIGDYYYMSYHPHNGSVYVPAYLWSTDLLNWNDVLNTWFTVGLDVNDYGGAGTMFFKNDNGLSLIYSPNDQVYIASLSNNGQNNLRVSDDWTTFNSTRSILSGGKNEIIAPTLSASLSLSLDSDLVSNRGTYKIIQNKSSVYSITITPQSGVTVDGSSSSFTVLPEETKWIYLESTDSWVTLELVQIPTPYTIGNGLTLSGSTINSGGTLTAPITYTMSGSNRFNWTKTSDATGNSMRMLYSNLTIASNSLHELAIDGAAPIVQRAQFNNNSIHDLRPDRIYNSGTIDRFGISLYTIDLASSNRTYKFLKGNTNIQGNRVFFSIGIPTNDAGIKTEYTAFSGVVDPLTTASSRVSTVTGLGFKVYGTASDWDVGRIERLVGASVGLRTTATAQQIGFAVFSTNATAAGSPGASPGAASNNTTITNEIENPTGNFAFYDQTGWNNYFKGSLGLGQPNPHPSAKLDIVSTTQGIGNAEMTQAQRDLISPGSRRITIYCTDCTPIDASAGGVLQTWNGSTWKSHW